MKIKNGYIMETCGKKFCDEAAFKSYLISDFKKLKEMYKAVFMIENREEPGMPDLLLIDQKDRAIFVEVKYSKNSVIKFKRTQIPWYMRNKKLAICVIAYNDATANIHIIDKESILNEATGTSFKLHYESGECE